MSTALSPIRSMQRETTIIRIPHSWVPGVLAIFSTWSETRRFVRSISSSSSTRPRGRSTSRCDETARALAVPFRDRVERDSHHLLGALAHLGQALDEVVVRLELGSEL